MQTHSQVIPESPSTPRAIDIELLALDLNTCTRCVGTLGNIEQALEQLRPTLELLDADVNVRKIVVESEEQARDLRFAVSPTVRVNGKDIAFETLESECQSCTDLCGCNEGTSCRVWLYRGKEYTEAPVALVVESILGSIFAGAPGVVPQEPEYEEVPENLRRFFRARRGDTVEEEACCSPAEQETCCEPDEKAGCCDASQPETCGCAHGNDS